MTPTPNNTYTLTGSDGTTIHFDDIEYSILRDDLEGFSNYPVEYDTTQTPGVIGGRVINTVIEERDVSFQVLIYGEGRAQLEERRRRLVNALNPLLGYCRLYWNREDGSTYYLEARPTDDSPEFDVGTAHHARTWQCTVTLVCYDPCWHKDTESTHTLISDKVGFHLPFQIPFTFGNASPYVDIPNNGTAPAPVVIEMHGPLTAPIKLENLTTNESIIIRKNVLADEKITIYTDRNDLRVIYTDSLGVESNALSYCSVGSKFWQLAIGLNHLHLDIFQIGTGAHSTLTFRERQVAL